MQLDRVAQGFQDVAKENATGADCERASLIWPALDNVAFALAPFLSCPKDVGALTKTAKGVVTPAIWQAHANILWPGAALQLSGPPEFLVRALCANPPWVGRPLRAVYPRSITSQPICNLVLLDVQKRGVSVWKGQSYIREQIDFSLPSEIVNDIDCEFEHWGGPPSKPWSPQRSEMWYPPMTDGFGIDAFVMVWCHEAEGKPLVLRPDLRIERLYWLGYGGGGTVATITFESAAADNACGYFKLILRSFRSGKGGPLRASAMLWGASCASHAAADAFMEKQETVQTTAMVDSTPVRKAMKRPAAKMTPVKTSRRKPKA